MYRCFVRNWWKCNPSWPNGLEPDLTASKLTLARNVKTEGEARNLCQQYNRTHKPGKLSRKAEYEEQ